MNISYYLQRLKPTFLLFMGIQLLIRLMFVVWEWSNLELVNIVKALIVGTLFDIITYGFVMIPYALFLFALPLRKYHSRLDRIGTTVLFLIMAAVLVFDVAAEHAFWDEFAVRFNFIAVDYLIYVNEVVGNILESYPMVPILLGVAVVVAVFYYLLRGQFIPALTPPSGFKTKAKAMAVFIAFLLVGYTSTNLHQAKISDNSYANEIAANGIYSLFAAFNNNALSYESFYLTSSEVGLSAAAPRAVKVVNPAGATTKHNVIFIVMESMGSEYMAHDGNADNLTPNLDALATESLYFSRLYATGNRTVRGLEALTLSIPPAPGDSILKRPRNEHLFSTGQLFKDHGYATKFIYGGYGYFDNMNAFFGANGFDIVDRGNMSKEEIHFANVWGVSDEDLFTRTIREAREDYAKGKPFYYMVMTTSNHRPYTFPPNSAGIPTEGGGRPAGVRYADFAVGKLIEASKKEPWFKNTIFVFVADHTARSAGKTNLPPKLYHTPAIIYSPANIKPQQVDKLSSQIDLPVTVLGLLRMKYRSKFFGQDIMAKDFEERALIATHQKLGVYKKGAVTFLEPVKQYGAESEEGNVIDNHSLSQNSPEVQGVVKQYEAASRWEKDYKALPTTLLEGTN